MTSRANMKCELALAATLLICITCVTAVGMYTDCGSILGTVEGVKVTNCDGSQDECTLKRNTNITFTIDFKTKNAISKVNILVHGIFMGMTVPHIITNPDACKGSGLSCPLKGNTKHSYIAEMHVLKSYPKLKVNVRWELLNENNVNIICIMIPAVIR